MPCDMNHEAVAVMQEPTTTESEVDAGKGAPAQQGGEGVMVGARRAKALVGATTTAILAAAAMTYILSDQKPQGAGTDGTDLGLVSKQDCSDCTGCSGCDNQSAATAAAGDYASYSPDTGCGSWRRIAFRKPYPVSSEAACVQACADTLGCKYANYQVEQPETGDPGDRCLGQYSESGPGYCYSFADDCIRSHNPCWVLIEPKATAQLPWDWQLVGEGIGCENWDEARIGSVRMTWNYYECGSLCSSEPGCQQFNYQKLDCEGSPAGECAEQVGIGACYLYSMECTREYNQYWDLYARGVASSAPPATSAAPNSSAPPATSAAPNTSAAPATSTITNTITVSTSITTSTTLPPTSYNGR